MKANPTIKVKKAEFMASSGEQGGPIKDVRLFTINYELHVLIQLGWVKRWGWHFIIVEIIPICYRNIRIHK